MKLRVTPNRVGLLRSYSGPTSYPPPFGKRGSCGAVIENWVKSDELTARLSVTANPKNSRWKKPTSTDVRGSTSCWTDTPQFQSDGRTPQPCRISGSMVLLKAAVPKFRLLMIPQKSPVGPKSCA